MSKDAQVPTLDRVHDYIKAALTDLQIADIYAAPAIRNLHNSLGGWPSATTGAAPATGGVHGKCREKTCDNERPCSIHETGRSSTTERGAIEGDAVRNHVDQLCQRVAALQTEAAAVAFIMRREGAPLPKHGLAVTTHGHVRPGNYCTWCVHFGRENMRRSAKAKHCLFCSEFHADYKQYPPKEIFDKIAALPKGRVLTPVTVWRVLDEVKERRKAEEKANKIAEKAKTAYERSKTQADGRVDTSPRT